MRQSHYEQMLISDTHSLLETRVNEALKNIDGFHEVFSCKKGDAMFVDPKDRVKIW